MSGPDLIVSVIKPVGMSSFDVIRFFKKKFKLNKKTRIGHFGTLDPFAEGILLVGVGRFLKLVDFVHQFCPKTYEAVGVLGIKTNTGDCEGEREFNPESLKWSLKIQSEGLDGLTKVASSFHGKYFQARPQFSAAKLNGIPLYEYARRGELVSVPKMEREIMAFEIMGMDSTAQGLKEKGLTQLKHFARHEEYPLGTGFVSMRATVGTGTYIRTLFEDLCTKLSLTEGLGHLLGLKRVMIGEVGLEESIDLQKVESLATLEDLSGFCIDPLKLLPFQTIVISAETARKVHHGQKIPLELFECDIGPNKGTLGEEYYFWTYFHGVQGNQVKQKILLGLIKREENFLHLAFHANPFHGALSPEKA